MATAALVASSVAAQSPADPHAGHAPPAEAAAPAPGAAAFVHLLAPHLPMTADGSGTGWLPTASPMEMATTAAGAWALGVHGAVFPRVTAQDVFGSGTRGATRAGAPNWLMGMAQRPLGAARLTLRAMVSLDPLTEGGAGYPLLFQTGESYRGERLVDRQHPHDAVSEMSATVAVPLGAPGGVPAAAFAYAAYPGEPAVGPVAFMHRPSARLGPDAPLSHHWQDATHIVWGVATGGVVAGPVKLDASLFTGREPDEDRWTPDRPRFDSRSVRLSLSPSPQWSAQVSRAWLAQPEALEPGVDQTRTTAAVLFAAPVGADGDVTATVAWGRNAAREPAADAASAYARASGTGAALRRSGTGEPQHAWLAEATWRRGRVGVFGRAERVDKSTDELALHDALGDAVYHVAAATLGTAVEVGRAAGLVARVGAQATAYRVPAGLAPLYGEVPVSVQAFLRLTPRAMRHGGHGAPAAPHTGHDH